MKFYLVITLILNATLVVEIETLGKNFDESCSDVKKDLNKMTKCNTSE